MFSLRVRLALLSVLISGAVLIALSSVAWYFTSKSLAHGVDLRLQQRFARIQRDLHPLANEERYVEHLKIGMKDELEEGSRMILVRDDFAEKIIYNSNGMEWVNALPEELTSYQVGRRPRREFSEGIPPVREGYSEVEERERRNPESSEMFPPPATRFAPESSKGKKGKERLKGEKGPADAPGIETVDYGDLSYEGNNWRVISIRGRGYTVIAAAENGSIHQELDNLRNLFLTTVPLALLVIGLGGWLIAGRAMKPVQQISKTASQVTAKGLSERIPLPKNPDREIAELIRVLNEMMSRLEASFLHANRFSADVSHELKTPIAILQGEVEAAIKETEPGSPGHNNLLILREEIQRLKSITTSLMLLAKADVGLLVKQREQIDLSSEVNELVEDGQILAQPMAIEIESRVEPGIYINGDNTLIRQALLNLVSNGIKYNHRGGRLSIELFVDEPGTRCVFSTENTGPGIPEEDRKRIFDRFHRVDKSRSRNVDGYGLGLSLAKEIVRSHEGKIKLANTEEGITRFLVELPLVPKESIRRSNEVSAGEKTGAGARKGEDVSSSSAYASRSTGPGGEE